MKIAVDLRSIQSGTISGVENYTINLLENLLPMDNKNQYTLFYNSRNGLFPHEFAYVNAKTVHGKIPNKFLNLGFKTGIFNFEKFVGKFDCLFLPNLNQFNIAQNKKLVITVHDLSPIITPEFYDTKRRAWHRFLNYKKAFLRADLIFAVSRYTKLDLTRIFNVNPEKIKVVYPGIQQKKYEYEISSAKLREARNIYGLPGDYILFLNTIEPRKNLLGLIEAFEKLKSPMNLVIAGKLGWKYKNIFKSISRSPKKSKIKYIGYIDEIYKSAVIKMAKVLVYPSFYEGFGFQPLEAMALGTPVIASQLTSLPEVVGDSGLLINPYDSSSISGAIDSILDNEDLRNKFILKGTQKALGFNWKLTAKQVIDSFELL